MIKIFGLLLSFLSCSHLFASDDGASKRLERLKKRMAAKTESPQKTDDKKPAVKPEEPKKTEIKSLATKTEPAKPDEKKSEEKKPEESKSSNEKPTSEDKKSDEKKAEDKNPQQAPETKPEEAKKPEQPTPSSSSSVDQAGKVDLAKATADESFVDRNWDESMAERDKLENEGVEILKNSQKASEQANEHSSKIDKVHGETRALINQAYKDYGETIGTYEQMSKEVEKYLLTTTNETNAKIKDLVKDSEKEAKTLGESVLKIKKAIEEIDKLEKDNEDEFAKSQEKSVLILKKLGEIQVAYNDIARAKTLADAKDLIKTMQKALDECSTTSKDLEAMSSKISGFSKDLPDKIKAAKDAYQETQNSSDKVTEMLSSIKKIRLESSESNEPKVVKTLRKMSNFVSQKNKRAQEKPTTFGMAIFNFFGNVASGLKDFFVRLFVIQTSPAETQEPTKTAPEADNAKNDSSDADKKASEKPKSEESKSAGDKKEESKEDKKPNDKKTDEKKEEKPITDAKKEASKDSQEETKEPDLQVKQEEIKSAFAKLTDGIKSFAGSVVDYIKSLYTVFANKKKA